MALALRVSLEAKEEDLFVGPATVSTTMMVGTVGRYQVAGQQEGTAKKLRLLITGHSIKTVVETCLDEEKLKIADTFSSKNRISQLIYVEKRSSHQLEGIEI